MNNAYSFSISLLKLCATTHDVLCFALQILWVLLGPITLVVLLLGSPVMMCLSCKEGAGENGKGAKEKTAVPHAWFGDWWSDKGTKSRGKSEADIQAEAHAIREAARLARDLRKDGAYSEETGEVTELGPVLVEGVQHPGNQAAFLPIRPFIRSVSLLHVWGRPGGEGPSSQGLFNWFGTMFS